MLEALLTDTPFRSMPQAQPIAFELGAETWLLDPRRPGALLAMEPATRAVLRLRCTPQVLARLLTEPDFHLGRAEELTFSGNPAALAPVVEALSGGKSPLGVRLGKGKKR